MKYENLFNKIIPVLILFFAALALVGVDYQPVQDTFREGKIRWLMYSFALCGVWTLWRCNPFWALFVGWAFFRWVHLGYHSWGVLDLIMLTGCLVVGDAVRCVARSSQVAKVIAYLALLQGLYGALQFAGYEPLFRNESGPFARLLSMQGEALGTMGHPTILGPLVVLAAIYFAVKKNYLLLSIATFCVGITGSAMSVVSLGSGLLYLLWRKNRFAGYSAAGLGAWFVTAYYFMTPGGGFFSFTGRLFIWPHGWKAFLDAPFFGQGPGSWFGLYPLREIPGPRWGQLHNEFLQVGVEYGLVGLAILLAGLVYLMVRAQKMCPFYGAAVLVLASNSAGNLTMHITTFGLIAGWLATVIHHHHHTLGEVNARSKS